MNQGVKIHSQKSAPASDNGGTATAPDIIVKDAFQCSPADLFDALLNEDKVRAYTQADAKIDSKLGGKFTLFNGSVSGTITDLVRRRRAEEERSLVTPFPVCHACSSFTRRLTLYPSFLSLPPHRQIPYERINQAWRFNSWTDGHYSQVSIKITPGDGKTHLELRQSGVPVADAERTKQGWKSMQFDRLKMVLGYGTGLPF